MQFDLDFTHAFPVLSAQADFRTEPDDFLVDEQLGFALTGSGEHLCLHIEKRNQNTVSVAKQLADWAGIQQMDVGYCGLKDRHAVTRQWFSLYLNKKNSFALHAEASLQNLHLDGCTVIASARHDKKLRPGMHASNHFIIRLRNVQGDRALLEQRWQHILQHGAPNYFGEQRFGFSGSNLQRATELPDAHARIWRERKNQFAVSAVRAYLFNAVLAERIRQQNWQTLLAGEPLREPSAPLWGRGRLSSQDATHTLETLALEPFAEWRDKLEHLGLQQERRHLRLHVAEAESHWESDTWVLTFALPPGTYATSVLRELLTLQRVVSHKPVQA